VNTDAQERTIDRIRKLLRLSQSMYQAEAELAMQRAFELAAKHQIDLETLDLGEDTNRLVIEGVRIGMRLSLRRRLALGIVSHHFNVNVVISYPDARLFGTASDILIARNVYEFLVGTSQRLSSKWKKFAGHRFTVRRERSFTSGFFYGVSARLDKALSALEIDNTRLAVILADRKTKRDAFVDANIRTVSHSFRKERSDRGWLMQGYREGLETTIAPVAQPTCVRELPAIGTRGLSNDR